MSRYHSTRPAFTAGLACLTLAIILTGCPPRKPTPVAAPASPQDSQQNR